MLINDHDSYNRYGVDYHLYPVTKGKLGRLSGYPNAYRNGVKVAGVDVFYAPDPDAAIAAVRIARRRKSRVIFDIHEIYHDAMLDRWLKGPAAKKEHLR